MIDFKTFKVSNKLRPYIDSIVQIKSISKEEYKILTKSEFSFVFHYKQENIKIKCENIYTCLHPLTITGFETNAIDFKLDGENHIFAVSVNLQAKSVFKLLNDISFSKNINMLDIYPEAIYVQVALQNEPNDNKKVEILEKFISSIIFENGLNIYTKEAVKIIQNTHGKINIKELSTHLGYSQKQVERFFKTNIGITPKKLSKIIQFENSIELLKNPHMPFAEIAIEAGYFDQAHFISSFKSMAGLTPDKFIKNRTKIVLTNNKNHKIETLR